jgi:hypothetical protein
MSDNNDFGCKIESIQFSMILMIAIDFCIIVVYSGTGTWYIYVVELDCCCSQIGKELFCLSRSSFVAIVVGRRSADGGTSDRCVWLLERHTGIAFHGMNDIPVCRFYGNFVPYLYYPCKSGFVYVFNNRTIGQIR